MNGVAGHLGSEVPKSWATSSVAAASQAQPVAGLVPRAHNPWHEVRSLTPVSTVARCRMVMMVTSSHGQEVVDRGNQAHRALPDRGSKRAEEPTVTPDRLLSVLHPAT